MQTAFQLVSSCWAPVQTGCVLETGHSSVGIACWVCSCMFVCRAVQRRAGRACACLRAVLRAGWRTGFLLGGWDFAVCFHTVSPAKLMLP